MPPKNSKEILIAALEANLPIQYAPRSVVPRIGGIALTDRLSNIKPIGRTYLQLAEQYGRTKNLDPFEREGGDILARSNSIRQNCLWQRS